MKTKTSQTSKSLLLIIIIIINLGVMFVVGVVLAKSDHDHDHHHHHDHDQHGNKMQKAKKIYNGKRASRDAAKFMAAILLPKVVGGTTVDRFLCSAVIITHDMLLTAAHCVANFTNPVVRSMEILPGASNIDTGYHRTTHRDLIRIIQAYWIHPEYETEHFTFDLAVIKVGPTPWRLGGDDRLTVAQMPVRVKRERPPLKAYGYGFEDGQMGSAGKLNAIEYKRIYTQAYCELMVGVKFKGADIFFATKERSHHQQLHISSGQEDGDSGGGVFVQGTVERFDTSANRWIEINTKILVGIHSHRRVRQETMRPRRYFFHTNITTFLPWIKRFSDARFDTYPFPQPLH